MPVDLRQHAAAQFCYLTTTGRVTGKPHTIEIWFALAPSGSRPALYMLSGGGERADWVRNLCHDPATTIRVGDDAYQAVARIVAPGTPEDTLARYALCAKYQGWRAGEPLSEWGRAALPVAFELLPDSLGATELVGE